MRILLIHNRYRSASPSGEDVAVDNEHRLLTAAGHEVVCYFRDNDDIGASAAARLGTAASLFWSGRSSREVTALIAAHQPDIAHVHNTTPLISPSVYFACQRAGVPVVQTLHNYRLICPGGLLLRAGRPCEDCVGRVPWRAVRHRCYRDSSAASALLSSMVYAHRLRRTWQDDVDCYICLTAFARELFVRGGLPAERLKVRANALADPPRPGDGAGGYALFVGRLGPEKGVATLLRAWESLSLPLKIVGDGPLLAELQAQARARAPAASFLGLQPRSAVLELMQHATLLVIPSECYEGFPVTCLEAMACGTPMVVSRLGSLDAILEEPGQCLKFPPGDALALRESVFSLLARPDLRRQMAARTRAVFEARYAPARALDSLLAIYRRCLTSQQPARQRPAAGAG